VPKSIAAKVTALRLLIIGLHLLFAAAAVVLIQNGGGLSRAAREGGE
jgi:hypothetical protein